MITVYGRANSSNVQCVMWCAAELGLEVDRLDYGHVHGGVDTPEYLAMNPMGLVPTLVDGDGPPLWESAAIVRYLGARYGDAAFWPPDPLERAALDVWAEWARGTLGAAFTHPIFAATVRVKPEARDAAALEAATDRLQPLLDILDRRLADCRFVGGEALSFADIAAGHLLFRMTELSAMRGERPALARYYAELTARPAYRKHVMVSFDALRPA